MNVMMVEMVVMVHSLMVARYIKEFVHGDMGRTHPNIGSILGCDADILQLDVTKIDLDFPPPITNRNTITPSVPDVDVELIPPQPLNRPASEITLDDECVDESG